MSKNYRLWSDSTRNRHFLISENIVLPVGNFEIRTLLGQERTVHEEDVAQFEVSREEAKAWIKAELNEVFGDLRSTFADKAAATLEKSSELGGTDTKGPFTTQTGETPSLDLLAELADSSQQKMRQDPAELIGSVTTAVEDFGEILRKSQTGSDVDLAEAKARMKRMRETFNRHGIDVSDRADSLPDKLSEFSSRRAARDSESGAAKSSDASPNGPDGKGQQ